MIFPLRLFCRSRRKTDSTASVDLIFRRKREHHALARSDELRGRRLYSLGDDGMIESAEDLARVTAKNGSEDPESGHRKHWRTRLERQLAAIWRRLGYGDGSEDAVGGLVTREPDGRQPGDAGAIDWLILWEIVVAPTCGG